MRTISVTTALRSVAALALPAALLAGCGAERCESCGPTLIEVDGGGAGGRGSGGSVGPGTGGRTGTGGMILVGSGGMIFAGTGGTTIVGTGGAVVAGTGGRGTGGTVSGTGGTGTGGTVPGTGGTVPGTGGRGTGGAVAGTGGASTPDAGPGDAPSDGPGQMLFAYYAFSETSGTVAVDSSGNGRNGMLLGGAALGMAGRVGNGLNINGASGSYVALPQGLLDTVRDVTIAVWVRVRTARNWQRVFDFGSSMTKSMFLTPQSQANGAAMPSVLRFVITVGGNAGGAEQRLDGTAPLPAGTWQHIAIVLGTGGGTMYLNGTSVATNPALVLRPADLRAPVDGGATTPSNNVWVGRSQYADPYLDGEIDELRIYNRALSAAEITALANP